MTGQLATTSRDPRLRALLGAAALAGLVTIAVMVALAGADGPSFLGTAYAPFDPAGQARRNMSLVVEKLRLDDRRSLLHGLDILIDVVGGG